MDKIFISYRRKDHLYANRLYDFLVPTFGKENVFMDVEGIEFGDDFNTKIQKELSKCDSVIVLIGPDCLSLFEERKLRQENDYYFLEIQLALNQKKFIIPTLVGGTPLPDSKHFPPEIADLARLQSCALSDKSSTHWKSDVAELIKRLGGELLEQSETTKIITRICKESEDLRDFLKIKEEFILLDVDAGKFIKGFYQEIRNDFTGEKSKDNSSNHIAGIASDAGFVSDYFSKITMQIGHLLGQRSNLYAECVKITTEMRESEELLFRRTGLDPDGGIFQFCKLTFNKIPKQLQEEARDTYVLYITRLIDTLRVFLKYR